MKITNFIIYLVLLVLCLPSSVNAAPERRIALVIGNSSYESSPLKNPANDAKDMADTLKSLGFKVILKTNASKRDMGKSIEDFGRQLRGRDVGMFFYAGHGLQVNGANYLIPVGAMISAESDIEYEAIDAGRVMAAMHNAKSRVNIVILDACRDNPYARSFRTTTRGLAIIAKAPMGTIVSYSTSPGDVASDGKGRNSPYTSSLIQYMKQPGLTIEQVFKNTRQKLTRETNGKQVPWELSSLQGDFFFSSGTSTAVVATDATSSPTKNKEGASSKSVDNELELALAKVQEKKFEEEQKKQEKEEIYRLLVSDIKKYRTIKEANIDASLKENAWQSLRKKYPQYASVADDKQEMGMIKRVLQEDKSGLFKGMLKEEGLSFLKEIARDGRFVSYDDGTVLDTRTNLMWAAKDNGKSINWAGAKSYCENYRGGGYTDWRLPTLDELAELFDTSNTYQSECRGGFGLTLDINLTELIRLSCHIPWASDTYGNTAAAFGFTSGVRMKFPQSNIGFGRALPVRSAK